MNGKKVIAVVGATGAQGGGLARAIAADKGGSFVARALTRDVRSDSARELERLGIEVVAADVDDRSSLERAFDGAYGAFCVTFFWNHFSPERETLQAEAQAAAAQTAGLKHVVWSTLEDTRRWIPLEDDRLPTLMGRYKVPHFDAKGDADRFFRIRNVPTTFLITSFYWENFINFGMGPKPRADGKLAIALPMGDAKLPSIAAEDIGRCAYGIFADPDRYLGQTVGIAGEHLTGSAMAETFSRILDVEVRYDAVPPETYREFDFPGAADLANMFQFDRDFEADVCAIRSIERSRALNPALSSFERWLKNNKHRIPIEALSA